MQKQERSQVQLCKSIADRFCSQDDQSSLIIIAVGTEKTLLQGLLQDQTNPLPCLKRLYQNQLPIQHSQNEKQIIQFLVRSLSCKTKPRISQKPESMTKLQHQTLYKYEEYMLNKHQMQQFKYPTNNDDESFKVLDSLEFDHETFQNYILTIDCEMVRTKVGLECARITVIDFNYKVIYDEFVLPVNPVLNYNTQFSGITEQTFKKHKYKTLSQVQLFLEGVIVPGKTILVGHSLQNDLKCLKICYCRVIDTAILYMQNSRRLALKNLAHTHLGGLSIQKKSHDSAQDCKATLALLKLKVEVIDPLHKDIGTEELNNLELLHRLVQVYQKQVAVFSDLAGCLPTQMQDKLTIHSQSTVADKLRRLVNLMDLETYAPRCVICSLEFDPSESWQQYYKLVDNGLRELQSKADSSSRNWLVVVNIIVDPKISVLRLGQKCSPAKNFTSYIKRN